MAFDLDDEENKATRIANGASKERKDENMDIEVGEYVRLARNQGINKIIDKEDDRYILESEIADSYGNITWFLYECELEEEIVNHSKQPIDLIEEGDYVNGELITDKWDTRVSSIRSNFSEEDIKTILTKESYMANCYKVGGEDEKI